MGSGGILIQRVCLRSVQCFVFFIIKYETLLKYFINFWLGEQTIYFYYLLALVECYINAKKNGISFFASYLHKSMIAVNAVNELKYRIIENEIVEFDKIWGRNFL